MALLILQRNARTFLLIAGAIVFFAGFSYSLRPAHAADAEVFVTWKARTFVPAYYNGKSLATSESPITASVMVIKDGRIISLSGQTVQWYVNDNLIAGDVGLTRVSFRAPGVPPNTIALQVSLPDYEGGIYGNASIPVVNPEAVIVAPFPRARIGTSAVRVTGHPFFFNVFKATSLRFAWLADGKEPEGAEDPHGLTIDVPAGTRSGNFINTSLTITNPIGRLEDGSTATTLITGTP